MDTTSLVIIGLLFVINTVFLVYLFTQNSKLQQRVNDLLKGSNGHSIEDAIKEAYKTLDNAKLNVERNNQEIKDISDSIKKNFSKISLIPYNAYEDTGGKLSFVVCLLNNENNGILINSLHSRNVTRIYAKEVQNGEYSGNLSNEEGEALSKAISN